MQPCDRAEQRSGKRIRAGVCLSEARLARPRLTRAAQGTAKRPGLRLAFFCLLFFGEAKKSEAPAGAKPGTPRKQQQTFEATAPAGAKPGTPLKQKTKPKR
jgi:hypothetical protein